MGLKRIAAVLLSLLVACSLLASCSGSTAKKEITKESDLEGRILGSCLCVDYPEEQYKEDFYIDSGIRLDKVVYYDTKAEELLGLETGAIDCLRVTDYEGAYYNRVSDDYYTIPAEKVTTSGYACMIMKKGNTELSGLIDSALEELESNGMLDELKKKYVDGVSKESDYVAVEAEEIAGAPTYTVMVFGSSLPLDYIDASGEPAGFNTALLAEISKLKSVNFDYLQGETSSGLTALNSGEADIVFCLRFGDWENTDEYPYECTKPYYHFDGWCYLMKKSAE